MLNQVLQKFYTKSLLLLKYLEETRKKLLRFKIATLRKIPREDKSMTNALARLATEDRPVTDASVYRLILTSPTISSNTEYLEQVLLLSHGPNWMTHLLSYLQEGLLPQDRPKKQ